MQDTVHIYTYNVHIYTHICSINFKFCLFYFNCSISFFKSRSLPVTQEVLGLIPPELQDVVPKNKHISLCMCFLAVVLP